jgi:low temperature requirement protein LtrA
VKIAVSRATDAERDVSPLELFFDLVYVFAIGELSHHLLVHVDLRTSAETVVLALAVYYAWYMTAWGANWLEPGRLPVRLMLVGLTFASLLMSVAIGDAFGDRAWLFVIGYLLLQVGRSAFLIAALEGSEQGEHFVNVLIWELVTGTVWVAGAVAQGGTRLMVWTIAVIAVYAGSFTQHWVPARGRRTELGHTGIAAGHLIERFRLFFIIMLGETVLTMGTAFTGEPFALDGLVALAIAFAGTVAFWWCYFERSEGIGVAVAEAADDAGALGWWGTWTLTLIVLALIATAVGDQLAIADPGGEATLGFTLLTFGGPALFLLAQVVFQRKAAGRAAHSRVVALAALVALAFVTAPLAMIAGIAASTAVLVAVAIADTAPAPRVRTGEDTGAKHRVQTRS